MSSYIRKNWSDKIPRGGVINPVSPWSISVHIHEANAFQFLIPSLFFTINTGKAHEAPTVLYSVMSRIEGKNVSIKLY